MGKLVSVILKCEEVFSFLPYDVNGDGNIDVRDLCLLYAKISGEQGKKSEKRNSRLMDPVILVSNQNLKSLLGEHNSGIRFSKYYLFPNKIWFMVSRESILGAYGRNFSIEDFGYLESSKRILILRC